MPETARYALPFPAPDDPDDVPTDLGELAGATEAALAEVADAVPSATGVVAYARQPIGQNNGAQSFPTSASIFATDTVLDADGATTYLVRFNAPAWLNNAPGNNNVLELSLDGISSGRFAFNTIPAGGYYPCSGALLITPAAGRHYLNVRLWVGGGGVASILAGHGGANEDGPMILTVEPLQVAPSSDPAEDYDADNEFVRAEDG